jgi:hypothetical protein
MMQYREGVCMAIVALAGGQRAMPLWLDHMFLKFSDVPSDSTDPQHSGTIVLLSYALA